MRRTVFTALASMALTTGVITNAWAQKKQFYPTVVHLTRSSQSMLILYVQAFVLVFLLSKLLGKIFFGTLRQAETENLMERTWYAIIDTCLAFTMFRDDLSPGFVAAFTLFFMLKGFHWLCEDRVDFMERSPIITFLFKLRITSLLGLLALCDILAIWYAYERTVLKGASVQLVFGFEYAILLTVSITAFVKFILHSIDLQSEDPWENKSMYMLYLDLVMSFMRLILYLIFIGTMFKIHTLPIFALRPMYLAIRKFRKSLSDIVLSRRAIAQLEIYPNATEEELSNDNICIICREEMAAGASSKKLPCTHMFHAACLRSWFQRQQTCPTCRLDVLGAYSQNSQRANLQQNAQIEQIRAQFGGQLPPNIQNILPNLNPNGNARPAQNAQQTVQNGSVINNDLINRLHAANIGDFDSGVLPPPPPIPEVDLSKLTMEEVNLLESVERAGVEARIKHLQEIKVLTDAAILKLDLYQSLATVCPKPHQIVEKTATGDVEENIEPSTLDTPKEEFVGENEEDNLEDEKVSVDDSDDEKKDVNPFLDHSAENTQPSTSTDDNSGEVSQNELRRRRLAALLTNTESS